MFCIYAVCYDPIRNLARFETGRSPAFKAGGPVSKQVDPIPNLIIIRTCSNLLGFPAHFFGTYIATIAFAGQTSMQWHTYKRVVGLLFASLGEKVGYI